MWKFCLTPLNGRDKKANRRKIVPKIKQYLVCECGQEACELRKNLAQGFFGQKHFNLTFRLVHYHWVQRSAFIMKLLNQTS